jgi:flagellar biosynthetic protein FliQ
MDVQDAVDLLRQMLWLSLFISAPLVLAALVVGLVVGLLQALTQVQEQTVSFVPKLLAIGVVFSLALPWLIGQLVRYVEDLFTAIPGTL